MKVIQQESFAPPVPLESVADESLVLHKHASRECSRLAVLIHGLGGSRYGGTWGKLPAILFADEIGIDVGLYEYRTSIRRLQFWKSVPLEAEARVLTDAIRELGDLYEHIVLAGHSMGGVLAQIVIGKIATAKERPKGVMYSLVLFSSPQLGSRRAPRLLARFNKDAGVLRVHSDLVTRTQETFQEHVAMHSKKPRDRRLHVPTVAVYSVDDFWVDPLSATIGIESANKLALHKGHRGIRQIDDSSDEVYHFLSRRILRRKPPRAEVRLQKASRGGPVFDVDRARSDTDLKDIHDLAVSVFQSDELVSDLDHMREWWTRNPKVFWVVRRETLDKFGGKLRSIDGYLCLIPLSGDVLEQIRRGERSIGAVEAHEVAKPNEHFDGIYVGALVGKNTNARARVLEAALHSLREMAIGRSFTLIGRALTEDGLRLARQRGMRCIDGGEPRLGAIVERVMNETA
jgi:pimeloyl-ACP methyl ester carboxylesterase